jgi:hypothetical protein
MARPLATDAAALESARLMEAILHLADLISEVVQEEKALIARPEGADFSALVARKSHLALELGRLTQLAEGKIPTERVRQRLATLSAELAAWRQLCRHAISAWNDRQSRGRSREDGGREARPGLGSGRPRR